MILQVNMRHQKRVGNKKYSYLVTPDSYMPSMQYIVISTSNYRYNDYVQLEGELNGEEIDGYPVFCQISEKDLSFGG